jgi:hypothetical protein
MPSILCPLLDFDCQLGAHAIKRARKNLIDVLGAHAETGGDFGLRFATTDCLKNVALAAVERSGCAGEERGTVERAFNDSLGRS